MTTGYITRNYAASDPYGTEYGSFFQRQWCGDDRTAADKSAGLYPSHAYTTSRIRQYLPLTQWSTDGMEWYAQSAAWAGLPALPADPYTDAEQNALINKLYAEVKGSDFNLAVNLGQLNQTVDMFATTATKIRKAYSFARRGNMAKAAKALTGRERGPGNRVASNWLELQYGWLPLLGDVKKGAEWLAATIHRQPPKVVRVRKKYKIKELSPSHGFWRFGNTEREKRVQIIAHLDQQLTFSQSSGLSDPFSVAWELVPYSFVIDWFLPLGDFLQAAAATRQLQGTFLTTITDRFTVQGLYSGSFYRVSNGSDFAYESVSVDRTCSSTLVAKFPNFKPLEKALSLRHALNAIALLTNLKR